MMIDPPEPLAPAARALFSDQLPLAKRYAHLLSTDGVLRGLLGPRETPRLWDRHLLNCAAIAPLIENGSVVIDVGSGAGLPGIVLAIARPDLMVTLVEPLARRTSFLTEIVDELELAHRVRVVRARADEVAARGDDLKQDDMVAPADVVTARAVAPLDRLARWCLPLTAVGGRMLAVKGAAAADEMATHQDTIAVLGGGAPAIRRCGVGVIDPPTTVVEITRERAVAAQHAGSRSAGRPRTDPKSADHLPGGRPAGRRSPGGRTSSDRKR